MMSLHDPLLGLQIRTSLHWPMVQKGTVEARVQGHPLVRWLARQLARIRCTFEPDVVWQVPNMVFADPVIAEGVIFCHPSQHLQIVAIIRGSQRAVEPRSDMFAAPEAAA